MNIKVITPPTSEPITLEEAKLHLRVDGVDDDTLITMLITAAREEVERLSFHALMTQTLELILDVWPYDKSVFPGWPYGKIKIPRPPLQSVTSLTYKDSTGATTT